jgi:Transposase DDE domain
LVLHRYRTNACQSCAIKRSCTTGNERLISRWEHEAVLETVQARLDHHPEKMTVRRQTAEHPFGTIKCWMGATHFLMKRLPKVATEMALNVLAYNMKRARGETLPRLSILTFLLLLDQARIVIGDALLLRPLRGGTPVVVLCLAQEQHLSLRKHGSGRRRVCRLAH